MKIHINHDTGSYLKSGGGLGVTRLKIDKHHGNDQKTRKN